MCSVDWFPRLISAPEMDSLSDVYSSEEMNEGLVIRWEPGYEKKFGFFHSVEDFLQVFNATTDDERCFHEIFVGAMKPCFDIDLKASEGATEEDSDLILKQLITGLVEESRKLGYEPDLENDLVILTSHAPPRKWSYHIILNTYCLPGPRDCGALTRKITGYVDESLRKFVDPISSPNKSIRILGACKTREPDRIMIWQESFEWEGRTWNIRPPEGRTLKARFRNQMQRSLASWTHGIDTCQPLIQTKAYTGQNQITNDLADAALRALADNAGIPLEDPSFPYAFRDIYDGIYGSGVNLQRKFTTTCPICFDDNGERARHDSDNVFLRISGVHRQVEFVCYRAIQKRLDGEQKITTIRVTESLIPYLLDKDRGRTTATGRLKGVSNPKLIIHGKSGPLVRKCKKPSTMSPSPSMSPVTVIQTHEKSEEVETQNHLGDHQCDQHELKKSPKKAPKKVPKMPTSSSQFIMKQMK